MAEKKKGKKKRRKEENKGVIEKIPKKEMIKQQKKTLITIFVVMGLLMVVALSVYFLMSGSKAFNYQGLNFDVVKEGELVFYHTSIPLYSGQVHTADYNVYIRNDPRKLDKIEFDGEIKFRQNMVLNLQEEFNCEGKGVIAIANFQNLMNAYGIKVIKDPEAECDIQGKYMYIDVLSREETKIEQVGPTCYQIYIKDCEILEGTEKFMVESLLKLQEIQA